MISRPVRQSPIEPANLGIDTLPSELQRTARRLELTQDSDGDSLTVTKADLSAAIANPSAYLPSEVDQLKAIQKLFLNSAGTTLSAKVRVDEPTASTSVLATWGPAQLSLQSSLAFTESRRKDNVNLTTTVTGQVAERAVVTLSSTVQILMLDTGTEKEALVASGQLQTDAGTKTVEIWQNGQRLGSYRTTLPALRAVSSSMDSLAVRRLHVRPRQRQGARPQRHLVPAGLRRRLGRLQQRHHVQLFDRGARGRARAAGIGGHHEHRSRSSPRAATRCRVARRRRGTSRSTSFPRSAHYAHER